MIKITIIDDELDARQLLKDFVASYKQYRVIGEADSLKSGVALLEKEKPDILFLDIDLKDGTGFEVLQHFPNHSFLTIFVTAFDTFALKAFQFNAIDYILKPASPEDIERVLSKASTLYETTTAIQQKMTSLLQTVHDKKLTKLVLHTAEGIYFIPLEDVIYLHSEGNYTTVYALQRDKVLVSQNLGAFDYLELDERFFRTHQSFIVNMTYIRQFLRHQDGDFAVLHDSTKIPVSRRKKEDFIERMKKNF